MKVNLIIMIIRKLKHKQANSYSISTENTFFFFLSFNQRIQMNSSPNPFQNNNYWQRYTYTLALTHIAWYYSPVLSAILVCANMVAKKTNLNQTLKIDRIAR